MKGTLPQLTLRIFHLREQQEELLLFHFREGESEAQEETEPFAWLQSWGLWIKKERRDQLGAAPLLLPRDLFSSLLGQYTPTLSLWVLLPTHDLVVKPELSLTHTGTPTV